MRLISTVGDWTSVDAADLIAARRGEGCEVDLRRRLTHDTAKHLLICVLHLLAELS